MRSEAEIRENFEWFKHQCANFKDGESDRVMRQLEILLWVLGHERTDATTIAEGIWQNSRSLSNKSPKDYA